MIAKALASFAALVLASLPAAAQGPAPEPVVTGPGTRYYSGLPPVRFVKGGLVRVLLVHPDQLYEACASPRVPGLSLMGCARMSKAGDKIIVIAHPCLSASEGYAAIFCHESAHAIGGWSGLHEL